jgi:hypothetical protein
MKMSKNPKSRSKRSKQSSAETATRWFNAVRPDLKGDQSVLRMRLPKFEGPAVYYENVGKKKNEK